MSLTWFITGSSRGFGRSLVTAALAAGDRVVATARKPETLADLVAEHGDAVLPVALDVTDRPPSSPRWSRASRRFGRLDVVVNNAGYANVAPIETVDEADFRAQFETNFWGVFHVSRAAIPLLRAQGGGTSCSSPRWAGAWAGRRESPATRPRSSRSTASAGCSPSRRRRSGSR